MPYFQFIWTDEAIEHIGEHDISSEDFENVVRHPVGIGRSRSSDLLIAFGYTEDGRYIIAVYKLLDEITVFPVTAYEVNGD